MMLLQCLLSLQGLIIYTPVNEQLAQLSEIFSHVGDFSGTLRGRFREASSIFPRCFGETTATKKTVTNNVAYQSQHTRGTIGYCSRTHRRHFRDTSEQNRRAKNHSKILDSLLADTTRINKFRVCVFIRGRNSSV